MTEFGHVDIVFESFENSDFWPKKLLECISGQDQSVLQVKAGECVCGWCIRGVNSYY